MNDSLTITGVRQFYCFYVTSVFEFYFIWLWMGNFCELMENLGTHEIGQNVKESRLWKITGFSFKHKVAAKNIENSNNFSLNIESSINFPFSIRKYVEYGANQKNFWFWYILTRQWTIKTNNSNIPILAKHSNLIMVFRLWIESDKVLSKWIQSMCSIIFIFFFFLCLIGVRWYDKGWTVVLGVSVTGRKCLLKKKRWLYYQRLWAISFSVIVDKKRRSIQHHRSIFSLFTFHCCCIHSNYNRWLTL